MGDFGTRAVRVAGIQGFISPDLFDERTDDPIRVPVGVDIAGCPDVVAESIAVLVRLDSMEHGSVATGEDPDDSAVPVEPGIGDQEVGPPVQINIADSRDGASEQRVSVGSPGQSCPLIPTDGVWSDRILTDREGSTRSLASERGRDEEGQHDGRVNPPVAHGFLYHSIFFSSCELACSITSASATLRAAP